MDRQSSYGDNSGFKRRFDRFDDDHDGVIPVSSLADLMTYLGYDLDDHELEECEKKCDPQGNGTVKFADFVFMMEKKLIEDGGSEQEELYDLFCLLDEDDDGFISLKDLRGGTTLMGNRLSDDDLLDMIREADLDGDGLVSYREFMRKMMDQ